MVDEQRSDRRARLFLAARLRAGPGVRPVTIRNLSTTGAMIELGEPPPVGVDVQLSRGDLSVEGKIVWSRSGSCGVQFAIPIELNGWVPTAGQQRVDEDLARLRSGTAAEPTEPPKVRVDPDDVLARVSEELGYVARMLDALGDELASDPYVTARHGGTLQNLDIAMQTLGHLASLLTASDRTAAIHSIGMAELRRRLLRKPL